MSRQTQGEPAPDLADRLGGMLVDRTRHQHRRRYLAKHRSGLGANFADIEWVISAYMLAFAALLLPAGSLADRFGRSKMLMCGLGIFSPRITGVRCRA